MSWKLWVLVILCAIGACFRMFGLGLPENDAKYRFLAILAIGPIAAASFLGALWVYMTWQSALGILAGTGILAIGGLILFSLVSKILPKKIEPHDSME